MPIIISTVATVWWLLLAFLSRIEISPLQQMLNYESIFAIYFYFPVCILAGGFVAAIITRQPKKILTQKILEYPITKGLFYLLILIFLVQCIIYIPPALSSTPNESRLEWGLPIVHVLTETVIRVICLITFGTACVRQKILRRDQYIFIACIIYTILVVSRSFMLEIVFYWGLAVLITSWENKSFGKKTLKIILLFATIMILFLGLGNWRQGNFFSIAEYGNLYIDSDTLGWVFGYFLINFDNLALIINENYKNEAISNVFGSIFQTLKIAKFDHVDDYIYVGKFNLGTAFRPFVMDLGVLAGGLFFFIMWTLTLSVLSLTSKASSYYAIAALLAYYAFCFPITSRLEQPPYLLAIVWIFLSDRLSWGQAREKK
jgi:oligosaccharide repeat unit polymerase